MRRLNTDSFQDAIHLFKRSKQAVSSQYHDHVYTVHVYSITRLKRSTRDNLDCIVKSVIQVKETFYDYGLRMENKTDFAVSMNSL